MAYQQYGNNARQDAGRYHHYLRTDRPSYQPSRLVDPYEDYAYTQRIPHGQPFQDNATYSYNDQARYENMSQDDYNSVQRGQAHFQHEDYGSSHSTSDYISPPAGSRHDYILPEHSSSRRYAPQQSRSPKRTRDLSNPYQEDYIHLHDTSRQPGYSTSRINSRPLPTEKSNYRILKDGGFDTKHDFMRAHGIKPSDLDAYDQANDILDGFRHVDAHNHPSQNRRSRPKPEVSQYPRPRSYHHRHEREVPLESVQSQRPRSSRHHDERAVHRDSSGLDRDCVNDMETCIDSDVPEGAYISSSDIGSFKSNSSLGRYWSGSRSRSSSTRRQNLPKAPLGMGRSVSTSPSRRWGDGEEDRPTGRYVSSSPLSRTRSRRLSSTSIRSRSRSRVLSSASSILSYRSSKSPSVFAGSDCFDEHVGVRERSISGSPFAVDSGSDLSGSESGFEIESADEYDDDYFDDGFDEQIEDDLEFDAY